MKANASCVTRVHIEVPVKPTENAAKVKAAVLNVFPDANIVESESALVAEAASLDKLREMFRIQRIRDTARSVLRSARNGIEIRFALNKQAAFVGRVNFAPPSPMGRIEVIIEDENPESVIDFLTGKAGPNMLR
jgi:predicted RNA binding protein with dsRBD fold (UPF0201 family)